MIKKKLVFIRRLSAAVILTAVPLCACLSQTAKISAQPSLSDSSFSIPGVSSQTISCLKKSPSDSRAFLQEIESVLLTDKKLQAAELCALSSFTGSIYEQLGEYSKAVSAFTAAAGCLREQPSSVSSVNQKNQQASLLLSAVRCALSIGESQLADSLLGSAASLHPDGREAAKLRLYAVWSWLSKIEQPSSLHEPTVVLESYLTLDSMVSVRPTILFTLSYITGEKKYEEMLKKDYPLSPEASVAAGKAVLLPAPFMFFLIRSGQKTTAE